MRSAEQIGVQVLGCKIVLDDFRTGYSWLADITRLPADRIKINKALVRDLDRSTCDAAVASAILSLAQGPGNHGDCGGVSSARGSWSVSSAGLRRSHRLPNSGQGTVRDSGSQHSGLCGGCLLDSLKGRHYPDRR